MPGMEASLTEESAETAELAAELYLVPPDRFVATRDEVARTARNAGHDLLARQLRGLRRPTRSAWLVNVLARHERPAMERLAALGRELRRAQTRLDGDQLRTLSAQRQRLVADLVALARQQAADAGVDPSDRLLSEVEATLHAALVDLAASSAVLSGRLVRPMSHDGLGPKPQVDVDPAPAVSTEVALPQDDWVFWPVPNADAPQPYLEEDDDEPRPRVLRLVPRRDDPPAPADGPDGELAAAESAHWRRERELAAAEDAVRVAADEVAWFDQQRIVARGEKVAAEHRLAEARAAQRASVRALVDSRRALDAAEARMLPPGSSDAGPSEES
jgi:hypothetical protein